MKVIKDKENDIIIAIIFREDDWSDGLNFFTPNDLFIQACTCIYPKGKIIDSHIHLDYDRLVCRTHEVTYVVKGKIRVSIFNDSKKLIDQTDISDGEIIVHAYGGHGYEILEDDTRFIEIKNGPFIGVERDKVKF